MRKYHFWIALKAEIRGAIADAAHAFVLEEERSGLTFLVALGRMGWRGWGWLALLALAFVSVLVATAPGWDVLTAAFLETPLGSGLLALWIPLLWTLLIVTTADLAPMLRLVVTLYSLYFWALSPVAVLPPVVLLVPVIALFLHERALAASSMKSWPWRIVWALLLATFVPDPLPFFWGSLLLKAALGVGLAALPLWSRWRPPTRLRVALLWAALTAPYVLAWAVDPSALVNGMKGVLQGVWTFSVPVWLWLGADLVEESERQGWFLGRRLLVLKRYRPVMCLLPVLFLFLGGIMVVLFWAGHLLGWLPVTLVELLLPLWRVVRSWPPETYLGARTSAVLLFPLGFLGVWMCRHMEPTEFAPRFVGLAVGVVVLWLAFWQAYFSAPNPILPQQWWPLLLIFVGWLWEPIKGLRELTKEVEEVLEWTCTLILTLITVVGALWIWKRDLLVNLTTIVPLMGIIVWGIPYLVARTLWAVRGEAERTLAVVKPFMAGYVAMLLLVGLVPWLGRWQPAVAFLLASALLPLDGRSRAERWLLGAQVGWGVVAFRVFPWIVPLPLPVPFGLVWLQRLYAYTPLPFLEPSHLVSMGVAIGAALPMALFRAENALKRWGQALAGAILWGLAEFAVMPG